VLELFPEFSTRSLYDIRCSESDPALVFNVALQDVSVTFRTSKHSSTLKLFRLHWVYPAIGLKYQMVSLPHLHILIIGVYSAFWYTGDGAKGNFLQNLGSLLDQGIQVVLYHGYLKHKTILTSGTQISCKYYLFQLI